MSSPTVSLDHVGRGQYCIACGSRCKWHPERKPRARRPRPVRPHRKPARTTPRQPLRTSQGFAGFDKDEIALLRRNFEKWKAEHGIGQGVAVTSHPAFRIALARLINDHGYSLTDVAIFLGVTRERVRQWVNRAGIPARRGGAMRIWSDEHDRFVTVENAAEYHRLVKERRAPLGPDSVTEKRWRIARWVLIELAADLGRVPCHADLADAFGVMASRLNGMLGIQHYKGSLTEQCDALWRAAGFAKRPNMAHGGRGRPEKDHKPIPGAKQVADFGARREKVVEALREYRQNHGRVAIVAEMERHLGVKSTLGTWLHTDAAGLDRLWLDAGMGFRPKGR